MSKIAISQAAKMLNVSIKTLQRWDEDNTFPALREEVSNSRVYDEEIVYEYKDYREARIAEKAHLNKLGPIRQNLDKYMVTQPYEPGQPTKIFDGKEMQKAYKALDEWKEIEHKLRRVSITQMDVLKKLDIIRKTKAKQ